MKKQILKFIAVITIVIGGVVSSNAQEVGIRFGDVTGGNVAIDGIFSTGEFNRIHADVSFGSVVSADLLWDFLYRPLGDEAFNWYMGLGPYLGIIDNNNDNGSDNSTDFNLGVAFEIGLEYHFVDVPVAIGLDYRPTLSIIEETDIHAGGFGFNVRYVF